MIETTLRALEMHANGMPAPVAQRQADLERELLRARDREQRLLAAVCLLAAAVAALVAVLVGLIG